MTTLPIKSLTMNLTKFSLFTACFAFFVILLGAFTRLTDAGLGCPDWPGCYGHLILPSSESALQAAQAVYPETALDVAKASTEMAHRYLATILGFYILIIAFFTHIQGNPTRRLSFSLCALVVVQGAFGMWTVTLKLLPIVVLGHLLLGLTTLSLLWLLYLRNQHHAGLSGEVRLTKLNSPLFKLVGITGLLSVIAQIILGGWVSTNYAALACQSFPGCNTETALPLIFEKALNFMGANHLENPLTFMDHPARMTIHMLHRLGAVVVTLLLSVVAINLLRFKSSRGMGAHILGLLLIQVLLGISNVIFSLPLWIAVAHNGIAALLLLSLISLNYRLFTEEAQ